MEISLVEEESSIEIIGNQKALKYHVKFNGKNMNNVPVFKHWLDLMKTEEDYDGIVCYCPRCYKFFYFRDKREKKSFNHRSNCTNNDTAEFCEYCDELYSDNSICCYKKGLQRLKRELYQLIIFDCIDYLLYIPFFSLAIYFSRFFFILFNLRRKGYDINYNYHCYNYITDNKFTFTIFILTSFCYSLVFVILFTGIYIWHIFFYTKIMKLKAKDRIENFIRY